MLQGHACGGEGVTVEPALHPPAVIDDCGRFELAFELAMLVALVVVVSIGVVILAFQEPMSPIREAGCVPRDAWITYPSVYP